MLAGNSQNSPVPTPQELPGDSARNFPEAAPGPAKILIRVTDDKLQAFLSIFPPARTPSDLQLLGPLELDDLEQRWREAGLDLTQLDREAASAAVEEWNRTHASVAEVLVAEAVDRPQPGDDARLELIVDPNLAVKPTDESGTVDFKNLNLIKPVKPGQVLARKFPAGPGIPGIDLYGNRCEGSPGADIVLPMGPGTEIANANPNELLALVSGFLQQKDGLFSVNECFVVDGSVDYSTGNITYEQSALIRGDIADNFTVNVGGALEVGGSVGEAKLIVGGDVLVKKGFVGSGHGLITAKGAINLGFASNQTLRSHQDIQIVKESFNCSLYARKNICVYGPLVGGITMAGAEILCRVAGNDMGTKTELEAGVDYVLNENKILLEEKIKELTGYLAKVNQRMVKFREAYRIRKRFSSAEAKLMLELRDMQEKVQARLPDLEKRKSEILDRIRKGYLTNGIRIRVEKRVNPGVVIKIGSEVLRIQEEMSGPKLFAYQMGRIKVL